MSGAVAAEPTDRLPACPRWRPLLMGVVNVTPDSFSDAPGDKNVDDRVTLARRLVAEGADLIDVGGESGVTNRPPVDVPTEVARVRPVIERLADLDVPLSVDTYKPAVARVAIEAGASVVNDVSGLADEELAEIAAAAGATLVITHTRARPKRKVFPRYDDVMSDVKAFLADAIERAMARGVAFERIVIDPGPDLGKTPAQTVTVLSRLGEMATLGRPLLLAASRKDFIGALTGRPPRERESGTLAALTAGAEAGVRVARVHDVAAALDFLTVRAALRGELQVPDDLTLPERLRRVEAAAR